MDELKKKVADLEALTAEAKEKAEAAGGTDESLNQNLTDAESALETAKKALAEEEGKDIDFKKKLEDAAKNLPPPAPKHTEEEKAKFTIDKIHERFPNLRDEPIVAEDDKLKALDDKLTRNQAETLIREGAKTEDEVKWTLHVYDNEIQKTGNLHKDVEKAVWLANMDRTKNAIREQKRNPPEPGDVGGAGAKAPSDNVVDLPPEQVTKLLELGLKRVAPDRFEGVKKGLRYDKQLKDWIPFDVPPKKV